MTRRKAKQQSFVFPVQLPAAAEPSCELCQRAVRSVSRHHLVPRQQGGRHGPTVALCQPCHSTVHVLLDNRALARHYSTVETLRLAPELQKYLEWVRRSRIEHISNRKRR